MKTFIDNFAEVIHEHANNINPEDELQKFVEWDSLGLVTFIAMVENEYNKVLKPQDIRGANTVGELRKLVEGE